MRTTWKISVSPQAKFIIALTHIVGPHGRETETRLIIDTGTPVTIIRSDLAALVDLTAGPDARDSRLSGPSGPQDGYARQAKSFRTMNGAIENFWVHCHDLDDDLKVDGVIGLDVIRRGDLHVCLPSGLVTFEWHSDTQP